MAESANPVIRWAVRAVRERRKFAVTYFLNSLYISFYNVVMVKSHIDKNTKDMVHI